jgi:hypothetical protein
MKKIMFSCVQRSQLMTNCIASLEELRYLIIFRKFTAYVVKYEDIGFPTLVC